MSFVLIFSLVIWCAWYECELGLGDWELQVGWGESSMIQAERLLFDAALEDPANQRFILLSDRSEFTYIKW